MANGRPGNIAHAVRVALAVQGNCPAFQSSLRLMGKQQEEVGSAVIELLAIVVELIFAALESLG